MASIVFIDTNIFLDFYKIEGRKEDLSILKRINENHDLIITSSQVEMEFYKNRHNVIIKAFKEFQIPNLEKWKPPVFLLQSKQYKAIIKKQKDVKRHTQDLKDRMKKVLQDPVRYDPVYKVARKLFLSKTEWNLSKTNKKSDEIRKLAEKRFILGYPPRKDNDTSMGDAFNWEWIIDCAIESGKDVVIVTRDSDYGKTFDNKTILNDWLLQEFREKVNRRRKIELTTKLTEGLKAAEITITKKEEEIEEELIETRNIDYNFYNTYGSLINQSFIKPFDEFNKNIQNSLISLGTISGLVSGTSRIYDEDESTKDNDNK